MPKRTDKQVLLRLSVDLVDWLQAEAEKRERGYTWLIERALVGYKRRVEGQRRRRRANRKAPWEE